MPNGSMGTIKNEISLARILLATTCPGSPAQWAGSFTFEITILYLGLLIDPGEACESSL